MVNSIGKDVPPSGKCNAMQIKAPVSHHCTPIGKTKFQALTTPGAGEERGRGDGAHCWWKRRCAAT